MGEQAGSVNPILRQFMSQVLRSLDALFSLQRTLSMGALGIRERVQGPHLLVLEEEELFTEAEPKANTKETMMVDEPVVDTQAIYLADADRVEKLLDIIRNTVDMPNVPCIRQAAQNELAQIENDLFEQFYPEIVAERKAKAEEVERLEAERQQRLEEAKEAANAA